MSAYRDKSQGIAFAYFNKPVMVRHKDDIKAAMLKDSLEDVRLGVIKEKLDGLQKLHKKLDNTLKSLEKITGKGKK